jgi:hypothetical protein
MNSASSIPASIEACPAVERGRARDFLTWQDYSLIPFSESPKLSPSTLSPLGST